MKIFLRKSLSFLFQLLIMLVMPFLIMVRGSVWLYTAYQWPYWLALLLGFVVVGLLLLIYVAMLYDALRGPGRMTRRSIKFKATLVMLLLTGFLGYSLFSISGSHAKGKEVQAEYTSLHPLLRLGVGTLVLFNDNVLVTDMARAPHDYKKMGLPTPRRSLHFPQSDGYAHAVDLRTKGHSEFRNTLLRIYFQAMGFQTLRHVGTADHLHVSLPSPDAPGAI